MRFRVSRSVYAHAHGRIFWSIFTWILTNVINPKSENEFVGVNIAPKALIVGQEVLKFSAKLMP